MFFLFFCSSVFGKIFPVHVNENLEIYKNLNDKTVVLVKSTVMIKNLYDLKWSEADPSIPIETCLKIYKTGGLTDNEKIELFSDKKYESHNVFFFTSYKGTGYYSFEFNINSEVSNLYGLKLEIFEGNPRTTDIVSGIDYQLSMLTQKVGDILAFARQNFEIEEMTEKDEVEFVKLYNSMFSLVFKISLVKIFTLFVTIFYFNKSVKQFFISNKLAK